jgi:ketosteroid isomerase-like protein
MSQENVEIVKRFRKAWLAGDFQQAFEFLHPAIEWDARHFPDGRIYHGHEGVREFITTFIESFDDYRMVVERHIEAGDRVIAFTRESGTAKGSQVPVTGEFALISTVRGGQIVHWVGYTDRAEALEAVGLSE